MYKKGRKGMRAGSRKKERIKLIKMGQEYIWDKRVRDGSKTLNVYFYVILILNCFAYSERRRKKGKQILKLNKTETND